MHTAFLTENRIMGAYNSATDYLVGDIITYNDGVWIAMEAQKNNTPAADSEVWQPVGGILAGLILGQAQVTDKALILASSTASSTKKFKITVIDAGTISATEIT